MATRVTYAGTRADPQTDRSVPSVLAIVVTHDGKDWLRESLVGLHAQRYPVLDVLVIDDASPDPKRRPTVRRIAKRHLRGRRWGYVRTPRPLGFGGAINWALSRVRTDADLLLFLHDDAVLEPGSLQRMVARLLADDSTAIVGPKVVSWDAPDRLEEIGMAVDRLGYPYKGLDKDEIDLGQHDRPAEVFFVTSTCMLVRHEIFRSLRGWDARLRAFSEDLDLCWRARVAGYGVLVEPRAKARHLMGLATGVRRSPFKPIRYFIRRNRLRTMAKNVSGVRLLALFPLFMVLWLVEVFGFIVLRQPGEILNLTRALAWNFVVLPQTITERVRIQRQRRVPDRKLLRLTVRESTRVRSYIGHQTERLEEAWGRRAELLARQGEAARLLRARLRGWPLVFLIVGSIGFIISFRHILFDPPAVIGELLPYPDRATAMWRSFFSPWRAVGLGEPGPALPAFAMLGIFPILTLGAVGIAQKLLLFSLGIIAFIGAGSLVGELVDKPARRAAGAAYVLGAIGYAGIRDGALGAMVFGAAAPFALLSMIRLIGWVRPPGWDRGRAVARVALASAISGAFVPGSFVLYVVVAVLLSSTRTFLDRGEKALRGFLACAVGLVTGWILLLPWSASWFSEGGPLERLTDDTTWRLYAAGFSGHGAMSVLLGQTPDFPPLPGIALVILGIMAVLVGIGQRRHLALALWTIVVVDAYLVSAISGGMLRPFVASPIEAAVPAWLAFSGLTGLAVAAFRQDLSRRGLGPLHALALGSFALSALLIVAGLGPALIRGEWEPGAGTGRISPRFVAQVRDSLQIEADIEGQTRALWVGEGWSSPIPSVARPTEDFIVTGPRGQQLSDLFETKSGRAEEELGRAIASIREGATDRGGNLLGAFNVRFVILERGPGTHAWLAQRDLALFRLEDRYMVLENKDFIARAGVYREMPAALVTLQEGDSSLSFGEPDKTITEAQQRSSSQYVAERIRPPGVAVLTESLDARWNANVDGEQLERIEAGWANAFELPPAGEGRLSIRYPQEPGQIVWLLLLTLAWVVVLGGALSRRRRTLARTLR